MKRCLKIIWIYAEVLLTKVISLFGFKKDASVIPSGPYCYTVEQEQNLPNGSIKTKVCKYHRNIGKGRAACTFVGYAGWDIELNDQCKICGENDEHEAPEDELLEHVHLCLDRLAALEAGWDMEGAEPVSPIAIASARKMINDLHHEGFTPEFVVPGKNGQVIVEYQNDRECSVEVVVKADGMDVVLWLEDRTEKKDDVSMTDVIDLLRVHLKV